MSAENVEVVRRMYEAYLGPDPQSALEYFQSDAEVDLSVRGDVGVAKGREAIMEEAVNPWLRSWDDYEEEIEEVRDLGDQVLVVATQRGRGKGSGIEISNEWAFLVEVREGMIVKLTGYADIDSALKAAGQSAQG